jgi:Phage capsid family.
MAYVTTPALAGTLKSPVKGGAGSGRFISENGEVNGFPIYNTSSMTANNILLGSFSDLIVAQFGAVEVITQQNATTGVLDLGVHLLADVGVRRAEAFAKGA